MPLGHPHRRCSTTRRDLVEKGVGVMDGFRVALASRPGGHTVDGLDVSKHPVPSRELTYPPKNGILKMIFLFPRWDMLIPWRVNNGDIYIHIYPLSTAGFLNRASTLYCWGHLRVTEMTLRVPLLTGQHVYFADFLNNQERGKCVLGFWEDFYNEQGVIYVTPASGKKNAGLKNTA